ncbi:MAG TPA: hypothetical protein VGD60_11455 [Candidatus Acidoferrales bacterium]
MESDREVLIVLTFDRGWGFGEIIADRRTVFLHHSEIQGSKNLRPQDRVSCVVVPSNHPRNPWRALGIEILSGPTAVAAL